MDLAELFNGLNSILRELAYIAHEEGDWRGFADVDVLQLAMRTLSRFSPEARETTEKRGASIRHPVRTSLVRRRGAIPASRARRECVGRRHVKRLKNIKTAIDIAHAAKRQDDIYAAHMDPLVEGVIGLVKLDLRMKRIASSGDTP